MRNRIVAALLIALAAVSGSINHVAAQGFTLTAPTFLQGLIRAQGLTPTATGCTVTAGSTDTAGNCTTTATSGSIVFAVTTLAAAPNCVVVDASASAAIPVYTVTATQITLTTVTSAHVLRWVCFAQGQG